MKILGLGEQSLNHFEWRNSQYPGYIELMPVKNYDNKVVLDYGCGPGNDLVGFSEFSNPKELIGADVSKPSLELAKKRLLLHRKDVRLLHLEEKENKILLADNSIDLIHSSGVLHHCKNLNKFKKNSKEFLNLKVKSISWSITIIVFGSTYILHTLIK